MEFVLTKLLSLSLGGSLLVLAVAAIRLLLKKAPKSLLCALWALVALRLLVPFSFGSAFSLMPGSKDLPSAFVSSQTEQNAIFPDLQTESVVAAGNVANSTIPTENVFRVLAVVWIVGMAVMLLYAAVSYALVRKKVRTAMRLRDNIRLCDDVDVPFCFGIMRPRIILPSSLSETEADCVLLHETAHLKRGDHLWKPLGFALLSVYWFSPLLWLGYWLFCRDLELACDERVIRDMQPERKKAYMSALLRCSVPRERISACPLAFGEIGVKARIKAVLHYKKPAFWLVLLTVLAAFVLLVGFMTEPLPDTLANTSYRVRKFYYSDVIGADRANREDKDSMRYTVTQEMHLLTSYGADTTDRGILHEANAEEATCFDLVKETLPVYDRAVGVHRLYASRDEYNFLHLIAVLKNGSVIAATIPGYPAEYVMESMKLSADGKAESQCRAYRYESSEEPIKPTILLSQTDDTFQFTYSAFSSTIAAGRYELTDDTLTLICDDSAKTYVFRVQNADEFVFDASRSSPIPSYRYSGEDQSVSSPVPHGAVFRP